LVSFSSGSTFKLVTISAALEEKLTNPDEVFDCQMGSIVYNGMRIRDSKPHGLLPVWGVLAESSDVGSIKIALRLGEDRFYKYIRAFGFGQQTGIADSVGGIDFDIRERRRVGSAAHCRGTSRTNGYAADGGFSSGCLAPRDFELHCG
jgi:cell division protein FtsI/penicillin-binding protein 2